MRSKEENIELIKKLSDANGISGFEDEVVAICKEELADQCHFEEDTLRNLCFTAKNNLGDRPKVWLDAHTDEVGFIVQHLKNNGTMGFMPIGGWVPSTIPGSKVRIKDNQGTYISGVVASKPPHFMTDAEQKQGPAISQMTIDVGACSLKELKEDFDLSIAAPVVPDVVCEYNEKSGLFLGKAFDCRIGVAALIETVNQLEQETLDVDVVGSFTSQEEVGIRGARVAAQSLHGDVAIVFEGAPADDTFYGEDQIQSGIKRGPMIRHFDVTMISNPRLMKHVVNVAKTFDIPLQEAVRTGGGTNGSVIHLAKNGIPTVVISMPVRYVHSHHGYVAYEDYQQSVQLAKAIIKSLNADVIAGF